MRRSAVHAAVRGASEWLCVERAPSRPTPRSTSYPRDEVDRPDVDRCRATSDRSDAPTATAGRHAGCARRTRRRLERCTRQRTAKGRGQAPACPHVAGTPAVRKCEQRGRCVVDPADQIVSPVRRVFQEIVGDAFEIGGSLVGPTKLYQRGRRPARCLSKRAPTSSCVRVSPASTWASPCRPRAQTSRRSRPGAQSPREPSAGAVYAPTLSPQQTRTFPIVHGSYESSGQSSDGKDVLEIQVWVFSRGCDFALAVCALNSNRVCQP